VRLQSLHFEHPLVLEKHRAESSQNVRRLQRIFQKTGCFRLQDENVINAVVEEHQLAAALRTVNLSTDGFRNIRSAKDAPTLALTAVQCLEGLHRIKAAERVLSENDKWWVVRLFSCGQLANSVMCVSTNTLTETPQPVLCQIIESYMNEQKPSDGEIFRKIRLYNRQREEQAENRWWARLDNSKPKDLRQLVKRRTLISAFDKLIDMPGLWVKVQLGALHRLLVLRCDEVRALPPLEMPKNNLMNLGNGSLLVPYSRYMEKDFDLRQRHSSAFGC
jgi:hypothetical protein